MSHAVTTRRFRAPQPLFLRTLAGGKGKVIVAGGAAIAVAGTALAIGVDIRWLIVALMVLLIIAPGLLSLLYLFRGTQPTTALNRTLHNVEITPEGIRIFIYEEVRRKPAEDEEDTTKEDEKSDGDEEPFMIREAFIPISEISRYRANSSAVILKFHTPGAFLILPYSAFPSEDALRRAVEVLTKPSR